MQPLFTSEPSFDSPPSLWVSSAGRPHGRSAGAEICVHAGVAQLVEHRFCKPKVRGSSPLASSAREASSVPFRGVETPLVAASESQRLTPTHHVESGASYLVGGGSSCLAASRHREGGLVFEGVAEDGGARGQQSRLGAADQTSSEVVAKRQTSSTPNVAEQRGRAQHRRRPSGSRRSARGFWGKERDSFARRGGLLQKTPKDSVGCPSGQREQAVNLPASAYEGSNPSPTTTAIWSSIARESTCFPHASSRGRATIAGVTQLVECQPSKLNVASSNLVSRSTRKRNPAHIAQSVERVLGKDEVTSSNLVVGSHG